MGRHGILYYIPTVVKVGGTCLPCPPPNCAHDLYSLAAGCLFNFITYLAVPCIRWSSVNSGAWLRRFDDVTRVAKTDTLRWAMKTKLS